MRGTAGSTGERRLTIWTYALPSLRDGTPERIKALVAEGGEGLLILSRDELHGGAFLGDRFPAHRDIAERLAGCKVILAGMRLAGSGYNFWAFPDKEKDGS